jgi:hypothetical protein
VLIARARQRSDVRTRSHIYAVRQRQRQSNLPPQLPCRAAEEGHAAAEGRQLGLQRSFDPLKLVGQLLALALVGNRPQRRGNEVLEDDAPGAADPPVGSQLQIETDHRRRRRFEFGQLPQMLRRQYPIGRVTGRSPCLAQLVEDLVPHLEREALMLVDPQRWNAHVRPFEARPTGRSGARRRSGLRSRPQERVVAMTLCSSVEPAFKPTCPNVAGGRAWRVDAYQLCE